ncbi:SDR family NAD(P)-dependent oxidoreductase, partial [Rhizobiaceae sp. 2RAB30]
MGRVEASTNVLITGAARRIGRAIAEDLAANGFGIAVHCNTARNEADGLVAAIRDRGGRA